MTEELAFIGDVHGAVQPLTEVIDRAFEAAESVVLLGDYVNRGAESCEVLDLLVGASRDAPGRVHLLAGHHDLAFLAALDEGRVDEFLRMGGAATLSSYPRYGPGGIRLSLHERVPFSHVELLRGLVPSFSSDGCVAMHDQRDFHSSAGRFGVFGHRLLVSGDPLVTEKYALIDTGCGTLPHGRLTCFLWPSRRWFQST